MFRILFVLIAAAVITFGTILLGNYLQRKVDEADASSDISDDADRELPADDLSSDAGDHYDSPTVFGASLKLQDYSGEDEAVLAINTLSGYYDTVLMPITDADGMLLFQSPALCELNRIPRSADDSGFRLFSSAAAAVKVKNMRLCVSFSPNGFVSSLDDAALIDGTLISELALYGADEVLITLPDDVGTLSAEAAEKLSKYIIDCRRISGDVCPIGVLISSEVYLDDASAKQIQQIAEAASFLAINFAVDEDETPAGTYRYVSRSITSLLGSFTVYNMRVILDGPSELLPPEYKACQDGDISNICIASYVLPDELDYRAQPSDETETETEADDFDPEEHSNPYASDASKYETEETAESTADDETGEPDETESDEKRWY